MARTKLAKGNQVKIVKDETGEWLGLIGLVKEIDVLEGAPHEKPDEQILVDFGEAWFSRDEIRRLKG